MADRPRILLTASVPVHFRAFHLPWVRRLHDLGCEVHGAADRISEVPECVAAFDRVHDVPFSRSPLDGRAALAAQHALAEVLRDNGFDLVHAHTPVAAFLTRKAAHPYRAAGLKTVYTAHGFHFHRNGSPLKNAVFCAVEKRAGGWTDHLVVINREDELAARRLRIVPPDRVVHIPGVGIDLDEFSPARIPPADTARVRRELGLAPGDRLAIVVAELIDRKRPRDVVDAVALLDRPDIHVAFVGDGAQRSEVEAHVVRRGLSRTVHFLGYRRDIAALLRTADCALLTSQFEGLPRSVMEALCMEVPVIGSDARGIRDLLVGGGGIIVPVGDTRRLAEAIREVLDHPETAAAVGVAGRRSMAPYALGNVLSLNQQLYERALGVRLPVGRGPGSPTSMSSSSQPIGRR